MAATNSYSRRSCNQEPDARRDRREYCSRNHQSQKPAFMRIVLFLFLSPLFCFSQGNYSTQDLKAGKFEADSSYIYSLPFENKKKVFLIQGYESKIFSHKNERALDFKVKKGTKVCAARAGVVISVGKTQTKAA